jgi:glycosyltransferase involved in cell wall biosynthesis
LAQGLRDANHEVFVASATPHAAFEEVRDGIQTFHLHSDYPQRFRAWLSLYNPQTATPLKHLMQRLRPDVVNAHNVHLDLSYHSLTIARKLGIRTVFSSHDVMPFAYTKLSTIARPDQDTVPIGGYRLPPLYNLRQNRLRYNPFRNLVIRRILSRTDARTAVSHELARAHQENDLPPFSVIHNGIDAAHWQLNQAAMAALKARLNLMGRKVIFFGGRLTNAKGTQQLLAALAQLIPTIPNVLLLVASNVPIDQQLSPQQVTLLGEHVRSAGWLSGEQLVAAYYLAQVIVTPSIIFDSFPTMNLEAMACGKPVITTCFGGAKEAVIDGETGYMVNPFRVDDFADKLRRILTDDALATRMGQAGYERVTQEFTMRGMVEGYESLVFSR